MGVSDFVDYLRVFGISKVVVLLIISIYVRAVSEVTDTAIIHHHYQ